MSQVTHFGEALKAVLKAHNLLGREFAHDIGIAPSSLSRIMAGHSKPRQVTFSRICEVLKPNHREEQLLVRWFTNTADGVVEEWSEDSDENRSAEVERCERYLEIKAQSIAFKRAVARELDKAGISYKQDYAEGIYVTDFLVERAGQRIALECKFNVQRDMDKTVTVAEILREKLDCHQVIVVVPFADETTLNLERLRPISLTSLTELKEKVSGL